MSVGVMKDYKLKLWKFFCFLLCICSRIQIFFFWTDTAKKDIYSGTALSLI